MAANQKTITTPKPPTKDAPEEPAKRAPKTEKELREQFADVGESLLAALERAAKKTERAMKNRAASDAQREALRMGLAKLTERITRAARGEASAAGHVIPRE